MQCPECGYVLGAFDKECLKCIHISNNSTSIDASSSADPPMHSEPHQALSTSTAYDNSAYEPFLGEGAAAPEGIRRRQNRVPISVVAVILVTIIAITVYRTLGSAGSGVSASLPFLPDSIRQPAVVSLAAVTTESKASYSNTTFENVTRFRIVQPGGIETDGGDGWKDYLPPPKGEKPVALGAARTMEKMSYSDTTWVKVHLLLLTKSGNIYDSEDRADWKLFMASDGKSVVGLAAASYAEKFSGSNTTFWHIEVLRLLDDGGIESTEGGKWKLFAQADGKRILSISAASTKEKEAYSYTTLWQVDVFRLLDTGDVQRSDDGITWKPIERHPDAVALAAYNVEEKAAYSDTTWENMNLDYTSSDPSRAMIISDQKTPEPSYLPSSALPPPSTLPNTAATPATSASSSAPPPAFVMKTKAGGGAPPDLSRFKHY